MTALRSPNVSGSEFSEAFGRPFDIHLAVQALVSEATDAAIPIHPAAVVRRFIADHPENNQTPAELAEAVVQAAAKAGVPLLVSSID